jgi:hypothetical protein
MSKQIIMSREEAQNVLYAMWENGEAPPNFTEDHSEYNRAVECIMKFGYLITEDFF